jgi:hypothetical protein
MITLTEEQFKEMIEAAHRAGQHNQGHCDPSSYEAMAYYESEVKKLITPDVSGMLPTDEELDNAAIDFVNGYCNNLSGDLTQETECFDAGAIWMRERLLGNYR